MFQYAQDNSPANGTKLRRLDALEEYFWLTENALPHTTMILAELEGTTTVNAWRDGLRQVEQRYPLLTSRIRKNPGERPYFEKLPNLRVPLRVVPLAAANLDDLIAQEPVISFGYGDGPLARLTLCHSAERCAILFSAHHVCTDGRTNVQIMQDLIAAVSGEALGDPLPLLPGIGEFFGLGEAGPYVKQACRKAPPSDFRLSLPAPKVQRRLMPTRDLKLLHASARFEGTTVQGALIAAFFLAGKRLSERWRTAPVRCFSPIDLRPMLHLPGGAGLFIGVHASLMQPTDDLRFWEFARTLKHDLRQSQTKEFTTLAMKAVRDVVQQEGDPDDPNTIDLNGFYYHDLLISNYGDSRVKTTFGPLTLKSLYPAVITGSIDTQSISVLTVDGALHMIHISRRPMPSLMEDASYILREACGVSLSPNEFDRTGDRTLIESVSSCSEEPTR